MKIKKLLHLSAVVSLLGLTPTKSHASATSSANKHEQTDTQKLTFVGRVTRTSDNRDFQNQYIVYDQTRMRNFYLDDDQKARDYDQKNVEITGTLDQSNDTIHIDSVKTLD
jgi:hypothetical protein